MRSSTANATSKLISRPCVRTLPAVAVGVVPPSVLSRLTRDVSNTGAQAKSTAVTIEMQKVKARTRPSTVMSAMPVSEKGARLTRSGTAV